MTFVAAPEIDTGATAWLLASTALVLMMTPGLAFYYGGMVRAKNVLGMLMQNFTAIAVVSTVWVLLAFALAFGRLNGFIGDLHFAGLANLTDGLPGYASSAVPPQAFAGFQMMFAVCTVAIITGATADRWRFAAFVAFAALWTIVVYAPVAHWVFSPTGWAARLGALDFAGGTVVHTNAGAAALAMALILGRRRSWPERTMRPHNLPLVLLGTALLWVGWFGFNAGSALHADSVAATALINTQVAASTGLLAWIVSERIRVGKATSLGAASGAIAGLVAITPCAGYVNPLGAAAIGAIAGSICAVLVSLKAWFRVDDSADVVAVHLGGGIIGSLCVGLFATRGVNAAGADGLFYGGGYRLLGFQAITLATVAVYSFVATLVLGGFIGRLVKQRIPGHAEAVGMDLALHGESAYRFAPDEDDEVPAVPMSSPPVSSPPGSPPPAPSFRPPPPAPPFGPAPQAPTRTVTASAPVMPPTRYPGNGTQTYDPQTGRGR
jgi:Amt family ammonium transporter